MQLIRIWLFAVLCTVLGAASAEDAASESSVVIDPELAKCRYPAGPLDKARSDLDRAIEIAPQWGSAYARRGELRFDPKQPQSGLDDITTAIAFDPSADSWHWCCTG
jgi:tetratricopeptide (TPR) repeat protein